MRPQPLPARSLWAQPGAMLALCLAVFYAPMLLMAAQRRHWRDAVLPLAGIVWPLTVLGWAPILAPLAFNVGSGLAARGGAAASGWGLTLAPVTEFLGLLAPVPHAVPILFDKLGWTARAQPPHPVVFRWLGRPPALPGAAGRGSADPQLF